MNIRTNQVTQGAMYCAIYGLLLFLNQQLGLFVETSFPVLFSIPILVCRAKSQRNISWIVALSMCIMTFLFGSFTTWFYSWTAILTGYIYGYGIQKKWAMMKNFIVCTLFNVGTNFMTVFVWAKLFGMELAEDYAMVQQYIPSVSLMTFMAAFVLLLSVLEGLSLHFISILLLRRLRVEMVKMKSIFEMKSPFYLAIVSISIGVLYYLCANVLKCSHEVLGFMQIIWLIDYFVLDFYGTLVMLALCIRFNKRKLSFFATLGSMLPVIQWIWVCIGLFDCIFHIREEKIYKRIML